MTDRRKKQKKKRPRGKPQVGAPRSLKRIDGHTASLQLKRVFCKTCRSCKGHGPYRYLVYRKGSKVIWKYLGKAD